jgi:subtilisin family serine protease
MKTFASLVLALWIGACASPSGAPVSAAPAPSPVRVITPTPAPAAPPTLTEAPRDWHLLDAATDRVNGISVRRAQQELLVGRKPARTITVAVIDGGVDTAHVDLAVNLWTNAREVAGNGRDDDGNGYVDDIHGWNFIGGRDGRDVNWDTLELTRLHVRCSGQSASPAADSLSSAERAKCPEIATAFAAKRAEAEQQATQIKMVGELFDRATRLLSTALGTDSLTPARVDALVPTSDSVRAARQLYLRMTATGISATAIREAKEDVEGRLKYGLNPAFDSRAIVGDDPRNPRERQYGNRDVMGPDAKHGSHVSGIIGAVRENGIGIDGVAPDVRIMMIRTVPNGDERDKDVANAIRYAVDNGAQIINMSFGKEYSPDKRLVDQAVKYADSSGVLMVHAAGNEGEDLTTAQNFPDAAYLDGGRAANWIEVGASSWQGTESLAAPFSNYGRSRVDVFAPGVDILSTVPGGTYERESGTSMAAPVVSGLAALLMNYFPKLSAADVKRIILDSATRFGDAMVALPGSPTGEKVAFSTLSATGAVVNAYAAIKAAIAASGNVQ